MTTPDIAGLSEHLSNETEARLRAEVERNTAPFRTLERQAAEIERLLDHAAKTFADVMFLRKDHPGQSEQFYAEEASSLCRRALTALTGEDTATLSLSGKTQTDACTTGDA
jgi:acetylornithine deacetylase/succinyl-diaminopimelate desuccinylase-like protein